MSQNKSVSDRGTWPDEEDVRRVEAIYESGRALKALTEAQMIAPLRLWCGVKACILGARIAASTGARRLAVKLAVRARRTDPRDDMALAQFGYELNVRRGPFALWQLLRDWREGENSPDGRAEVLALKARAAADLRDFATAEKLLERAEELDPNRPWIRLQRAHLLECQDRIEEALDAAGAACATHKYPFYRAGTQTSAHLLQLLDRDDEAIDLLQQASRVLESGPIIGQLYGLLSENGRWSEADDALSRFETLSPLLDDSARRWLNAQRARMAYHRGQREAAADLAAQLDDGFHKEFAERLRQTPRNTERVQLDVTFVRQHFKTCAPATLAAIGRFWGMPSDHLKLAEAMCYDGTPHWQQRDWAEQNGWSVREFRVTGESALSLLERGLPFAMSLVDATSAHMVAVIGFDRIRGTLLLRDPGQPYVVEVQSEEFLERYRAFGPHGMIFVPASAASRLDGLNLPEANLYECFHRFWLRLSVHDRDGAAAVLGEMERIDPGAVLTLEVRLELSAYDSNVVEQVRCLDELLKLYPGNPARILRRLGCMKDGTREERIQLLEPVCRGKDTDPALMVAFGRALSGDARQWTASRRWLLRAMRFRPMDSSAMSGLADLLWEQGQLEEATECYRFAANLEGFREHLYQAWFLACRRTRRTEEAIAHLVDRVARFGGRSEQPALTLAWAWREMDQPARSRAVLEEAMNKRPDDGYLLLRAAGLYAALGENREVDRLHSSARGKVRDNDWLRSRAEIAESRLDFSTVLDVSRTLLEREPLALDAHAAVARALSRLQGTRAALDCLHHSCGRFPHHVGLQRMRVEWCREAGPEIVEQATRELLRLEPSDAWAHRELALALLRLNRAEEALVAAHEAARIEPGNTYSFSVLGLVYRQLNQVISAREQLRRAVVLSADNGEAVSVWLELSRTDQERREALAFIEGELIRQVVMGEGLLAYLEIARPILDSESLLSLLRRAHSERSDLWHAWAALASQLAHMGKLDESLQVADEATRRFPHLPRLWLELSSVHQVRNEPDLAITTAERAFEINPALSQPALALAAALNRCHRLDDARRVLERALKHSPHNPQLHAVRAELLWQQSASQDALLAVEQALRLAPGYDRAWNLHCDWSSQCGESRRPADFARQLTKERPGESRVWLMAARALNSTEQKIERLAAVEKAIQLDPCSTEAWDIKAELLARAERFDDAIAVCEEGIIMCPADTFMLRGRRAWIEGSRKQLSKAITLMREVLAENRSYVWGWNQLANWQVELGALREAAAALEEMQRLRPHDAWVSRQLGFLRLKQEDFAGARKAFAAAFKVDPSDGVSAHNLLDLQMKDADLKEAASTLQLMRMHQPGAPTLAAEVFLQLRQQSETVPKQALEALCTSPDPDPWAMNAATDAMRRAGQAVDALQLYKKALRNGAANPQLAAALTSLMLQSGDSIRAVWFFCGLKPGEQQDRAAALLVQHLAQTNRRWLFRFLLWRQRSVLFRDDAAWGQVGYALSNFGYMKQVAVWLSDWKNRSQVEPWMLFNFCLALRYLGQYAEATEVARYVIQSWGHRDGAADMHLFLAVEAAIAGDVRSSEEHLAKAVTRKDNPHDQQLLVLAQALSEFLAAREATASGRSRRFSALRQKMAPHFDIWTMVYLMRDVRRTFGRVGDAFHRGGAGWLSWIWFKWRLHWHWSWLCLCLLVVPLSIQPVVFLAILFMWLFVRRHIR